MLKCGPFAPGVRPLRASSDPRQAARRLPIRRECGVGAIGQTGGCDNPPRSRLARHRGLLRPSRGCPLLQPEQERTVYPRCGARPSRRAQSGTPAAKTDDEPAANSHASDTLLALAVTPSWGEVSRRRKRLLPVEAARRGDVARRDPSGNQVNDGPMGGSDRVDWTVAVFVQGCVGFRKSRIRLVRDKDASIRGLVWRSYRSS